MMYKRTTYSIKNPYGLSKDVSLSDVENPFILGMFPIAFSEKMLNGYMKCLMDYSKLLTSNRDNLGYEVSDVSFKILMNDDDFDFLKKLLQMLSSKDILKAKDIIRRINIVSYCDGHAKTAVMMKKRLKIS